MFCVRGRDREGVGWEGIEKGLVDGDGEGGLAVGVVRFTCIAVVGCCVFVLHDEGLGLRMVLCGGDRRLLGG